MAADWNDPTLWAALYRNQDNDGSFIGYSRRYAEIQDGNRTNVAHGAFDARWANLVREFDILTSERVLIVGCAYGYLIEAANDAGFANVWGIEASTYIIGNRGDETRGNVLFVEDDIRGGAAVHTKLTTLTGFAEFDWVISEDVAPGYTTVEYVDVMDAMEGVLDPDSRANQVIHLMTILVPGKSGDSSQTWLTLAEWNALRPAHTWVHMRTFEVM